MSKVMHRVYIWEGQSASARSLLDESKLATVDHRPHVISGPRHLAGLPFGTLVVVANHPRQMPADIMEAAERQGLLVLTLDDRFVRAKRLSAA